MQGFPGVRGMPGAGALTLAPMDVTNDDAMRHLCLNIHQRWGGLHLWVHTAVHVVPWIFAGFLLALGVWWSRKSACADVADSSDGK